MPLHLEIISEHRDIVGDDAVHEFDEEGGTIGRSLQSDWILPDPDRYISGRHATIDYKGGVYYLADTSSNGVYVNGEREPVGKGNPRRLFNGDKLRMGDFEIAVTLDRGESIVMPLEGTQTELPEPIEEKVAEASLRTGMQLLDEDELVDHVDFSSSLWGEAQPETPAGPADAAPPAPKPETKPVSAAKPSPKPVLKPARPPKGESQAVPISAEDLFDTFLDGVGVSRADLHPSVDPAEVLQNAGQVLRELVEGISLMLAGRRELKVSFNLDQTTVLPRHNNPMKLSENPGDSVMQLLVGREGEYLGPRDAAREVCRDLLHHQAAILDAMTHAFREFADRFDPDELQASFRREGSAKPLLGFLERQKFWQMYCDLYPVLTEKGSGPLPQIIAEEFVGMYERQIADAKRIDAASLSRPQPAAHRKASSAAPATAPAAPPAVERESDALTDPSAEVFAQSDADVGDDGLPTLEFDETFNDLFDDDTAA